MKNAPILLLCLCACQSAHPISGVAQRDACSPLEGGIIEVRGTGQRAPLDARGRFELSDAPEFGVLAVSAEGYATTLSVSRRLPSSEPFYALPIGLLTGLYPLAGLEPVPGRGTVALTFADAAHQPLEAVAVKIISVEDATDGVGQVRFLELDDGTPRISATRTETAPGSGAFIIFNAKPGWYQLQAERKGFTFARTQLLVAADELTADVVLAKEAEALRPVTLRGKVTGTPPWPRGDVASIPLAGAKVFVGTREAVTDAEGNYVLELTEHPAAQRSVSVELVGYPRALGAELCLSPGQQTTVDVVLPDDVAARWQMLPALAGQPLDAQRGQVVVHVRREFLDGDLPLTAAVIELEGADGSTHPAFYGHLGGDATCQTVGTCAATCAANSRCENGVCVLGPAPMCSGCDAMGACAAGAEPVELAGGCRCLLTRTDCFAADQSCPAGSFCQVTFGNSMGTRLITRQVCRPLGNALEDTALGFALFANVAPGEYVLRGRHAEGPLLPRRVRVEPGAFTAVALSLFTRARLPGEL